MALLPKKYILAVIGVISLSAFYIFISHNSTERNHLIECSSSQSVVALISDAKYNKNWNNFKYQNLSCDWRLLQEQWSDGKTSKIGLEIKLQGIPKKNLSKRDFNNLLTAQITQKCEGFVRIQELKIGDGYIW